MLMSGRSLPLAGTTTSSEIMPSSAWKKMWQWNSQRPYAPPGVTPSAIGRSVILTRNVSV